MIVDYSKYMFKSDSERIQLQGGVFGYLQRDIDKLIKTKNLDAEFMNFAQSSHNNGISWIYLKFFYTKYKDANDVFGDYREVKVAYRVDGKVYSRAVDLMNSLDLQAGLMGKQNKFSDIDLVKLRILFSIYSIIKSIQEDKLPNPTLLPTKKWLVVLQADNGSFIWRKEDYAPGGGV